MDIDTSVIVVITNIIIVVIVVTNINIIFGVIICADLSLGDRLILLIRFLFEITFQLQLRYFMDSWAGLLFGVGLYFDRCVWVNWKIPIRTLASIIHVHVHVHSILSFRRLNLYPPIIVLPNIRLTHVNVSAGLQIPIVLVDMVEFNAGTQAGSSSLLRILVLVQ